MSSTAKVPLSGSCRPPRSHTHTHTHCRSFEVFVCSNFEHPAPACHTTHLALLARDAGSVLLKWRRTLQREAADAWKIQDACTHVMHGTQLMKHEGQANELIRSGAGSSLQIQIWVSAEHAEIQQNPACTPTQPVSAWQRKTNEWILRSALLSIAQLPPLAVNVERNTTEPCAAAAVAEASDWEMCRPQQQGLQLNLGCNAEVWSCATKEYCWDLHHPSPHHGPRKCRKLPQHVQLADGDPQSCPANRLFR